MNEVFDLLVLDTDFYTLQNNETNSVRVLLHIHYLQTNVM